MFRIPRVYKDLCKYNLYRFPVQRGQDKMPRLDVRNFSAFPAAVQQAMLDGFIAAHRLRPASEFRDGAYIMEFWREEFLAYCRARRIRMGYFDFGFEEEEAEGPATQPRAPPPTPEYATRG